MFFSSGVAAGSVAGVEQVMVRSGMTTSTGRLLFGRCPVAAARRDDIGHHRRMQLDFDRRFGSETVSVIQSGR